MSKYRIIEENHSAYGIVYKIQKEHRFLWSTPWWVTITVTDTCNDGLSVTEDLMYNTIQKAEDYIKGLGYTKQEVKVIKEITI